MTTIPVKTGMVFEFFVYVSCNFDVKTSKKAKDDDMSCDVISNNVAFWQM